VYSRAIVDHSDRPGSLFWICHQVRVTGAPAGEAAAEGATELAADAPAEAAVVAAADGAVLDELPEQALKTMAVAVNRTATPRRNFMDLASCLIRCRIALAGVERRWRRVRPAGGSGAIA
jgi:hypothetical protein